MLARSIEELQRYLRRLCDEGTPPEDGVLLNRFVATNDREAFELLIARHGPMVLGTARRLVDRTHDAEDVFQAVFLSLARLARTIRHGCTLPAWLHQATCRTAAKVRRKRVAGSNEPPSEPSEHVAPEARLAWQEVRQALDEELQRLPERWRSPLLLCYLSGLTRDEAAKQLGWSLGTLKRRLEEGRHALRTRLDRRGISSVGLALTVLAPEALQAEVGQALLESTLILVFSTGAVVPATISVLVLGSATAMKGLAMKSIFVLLATAVAIALGVGIDLGMAEADPPKQQVEGKKEPVNPAPKGTVAIEDDPLPAGSLLRFGTARFRHERSIVSMAVSADGKTAFVLDGLPLQGTRAFDLATGRARFTVAGEEAEEGQAIAVSPDGGTFVTKRERHLYVFDARTGNRLRAIDLPESIARGGGEPLAFTPDGKAVAATSTGKEVHLIDIESGATIRDFTIENPESNLADSFRQVGGLAFSPDGKLMATGGLDNDKGDYFARLWDVETGKELRRFMHGRSDGIRSLAFSPDAAMLATRAEDGRLRLFDMKTGKQRHILPKDGGGWKPGTVAFAPDGKTVAAGGDSIRFYDVSTGEEKRRIDRGQASSLHFTDEGKVLVAAIDEAIYRWDAATGKPLTPEGGDSAVEHIVVTPDGSRVVTRDRAGDGHIWDGTNGRHLRRFAAEWHRSVAMSPDGRLLAWPVTDPSVEFADPQNPRQIHKGSRIRLYDLAADKVVDRFPGFKGITRDLAFTDDGKRLVTVDERSDSVQIWDVESAKEERSFQTVPDALKKKAYYVRRVQLSSNGRTVALTYHQAEGEGRFGALAHLPQLVRLWDVATGKELPPLNGGDPIDRAFSPDNRFVVTRSGNFVCDIATGGPVVALPYMGIQAAAFSRDGRHLAMAVRPAGVIQVWEVATWTKRNEFKGDPDYQLRTLTFGPEGRLFCGNGDSTVLAWDTRPPRVTDSVSLADAWNALATREAGVSFQFEGRFLAAPAEAVKLFAKKIHPPEALDPERTGRLLADLGSDAFAVREAASKSLLGLDEQAIPYLEEALRNGDAAELRARARKILEQKRKAAITPDQLRQVRAVMLLELIGDGDSKQLLKKWAGGPAGARLTAEASAALKWLEVVSKAKR